MKKTPRKPDQSAIAERFNVTVRTVRNWQSEGAPLSDLKALRLWLAGRKHSPVERQAVPSASAGPVPTATGDAGAAAALARLERQELQAYSDLTAAIDAGEPLRIRQARQNWLAIGDSLRKYDALVEQGRRAAGQLMPVDELRRAFGMLLLGVRLTLNRHGSHVANDALIAGVLPMLANEEDRWLHDTIRAETWGWIADCPEHIRRALILYCECLAACRSGDVPAPLEKIINRALSRITNEPKAQDTAQ